MGEKWAGPRSHAWTTIKGIMTSKHTYSLKVPTLILPSSGNLQVQVYRATYNVYRHDI